MNTLMIFLLFLQSVSPTPSDLQYYPMPVIVPQPFYHDPAFWVALTSLLLLCLGFLQKHNYKDEIIRLILQDRTYLLESDKELQIGIEKMLMEIKSYIESKYENEKLHRYSIYLNSIFPDANLEFFIRF